MRAPIAPAEFLLEEGFHDLRTHQAVFEEVASFNFTTDCDLTEQNPSQVRCAYVSHNLLDTLGIPLRAGRGFTTAEDTPNGPLAALLSDALWRTRYGADPAVLGRTLSIDGRAAVVAGILPSNCPTSIARTFSCRSSSRSSRASAARSSPCSRV